MSDWSTQQLTELLATLSEEDEESPAIRAVIDHAADALEAEVGAFVRAGALVECIGFPRGHDPSEELLAAASGERSCVQVPGVGDCHVLASRVDDDASRLVVCRWRDEFNAEERSLVRGMARVLALTLKMQRALLAERAMSSERERRRVMLEKLVRLQRLIVQRRPLQETFNELVAGAQELLAEPMVGLLLVDDQQPETLRVVASVGIEEPTLQRVRTRRAGEGVGGRAISEERLVATEDYASSPLAIDAFAQAALTAAMAAPVRQDGVVIGSVFVGSRTVGRRFEAEEKELLSAFAEHASLALNDASALNRMEQAFHDPLTGLPNRALFIEELERKLVADGASPPTVLFVDLDGFKTVNDSLGHAAGDDLLRAVAHRLRHTVHPTDTVARLGGDEFAILTHGEQATLMAERVIATVSLPYQLYGRELVVGASVGIACSANGSRSGDQLLRDADVAMYQAKRRGRGRAVVFHTGMHAAVVERLELEADLRLALERRELELHYQPIVDLASGELSGFEALLRWSSPVRGAVMPGEFIPIAEESGLIVEIDRYVLDSACREMTRLVAVDPARDLQLSVNLSARHVLMPEVVDDVARALAESGLHPSRLVLEITESVMMTDAEAGRTNLQRLKALGVQVAIDDFGTYFSSLGYLRQFPVDVVKIDRSFVAEIGEPADASLALAIIRLGHALKLKIVAEGIENLTQAETLRGLDCDLGQGFLYSRAVPAAEAHELVASRLAKAA